jgi:hypothetical protein
MSCFPLDSQISVRDAIRIMDQRDDMSTIPCGTQPLKALDQNTPITTNITLRRQGRLVSVAAQDVNSAVDGTHNGFRRGKLSLTIGGIPGTRRHGVTDFIVKDDAARRAKRHMIVVFDFGLMDEIAQHHRDHLRLLAGDEPANIEGMRAEIEQCPSNPFGTRLSPMS